MLVFVLIYSSACAAFAPPGERLDAAVVFDEHRVNQVLYSGTCGSRMTLDPDQIEELKIPGTPLRSYWSYREPTPWQPHYVKALGCDWLTADGAPVLSLNELQPYASFMTAPPEHFPFWYI